MLIDVSCICRFMNLFFDSIRRFLDFCLWERLVGTISFFLLQISSLKEGFLFFWLWDLGEKRVRLIYCCGKILNKLLMENYFSIFVFVWGGILFYSINIWYSTLVRICIKSYIALWRSYLVLKNRYKRWILTISNVFFFHLSQRLRNVPIAFLFQSLCRINAYLYRNEYIISHFPRKYIF